MSRRPVPPRARGGPKASPGSTATAPRRPAPRAVPRPGGPASSRSGSTRPAARQPSTAGAPTGADEEHEPRARQLARLISVRALVLGVVLLVGFSMLFPTVRAYLGQRAEIDSLAAQVEQAEQAEQDLRTQLDRWDDDAYVAAQARSRLFFVWPGETAYRVIDPEIVVEEPVIEGSTTGSVAGPALPVGGALDPWYATIWESVRLAGDAAVPSDDERLDGGAVPEQPVAEQPDAEQPDQDGAGDDDQG